MSRMVRNWGAHSGHSRSLSPRARALKLCPHMKCTAGSSNALPLSAQRLFWNTRAWPQACHNVQSGESVKDLLVFMFPQRA